MKEFIRVMKSLSDPNRVKILKILGTKELCVGEITDVLGLAQSTVSKHLKILEDADLVESRKVGSWVNYKLLEDSKNHHASALQKLLKGWLEDNTEIQKAVLQASNADRQNLSSGFFTDRS